MKNNQIPDIILERYILKELDIKKMDEIRMLCESNPDVASRVMDIRKSNEEILKEYPEDKIAAEIMYKCEAHEKSSAKTHRPLMNYLRIIAPVAAATALVLFILMPAVRNNVAVIDPNEITREKGSETSIYLYRKNIKGEVDIMKNGSRAKAGDLLQIGYSSLKKTYGIILSIDGRGNVTLHYPDDEKASTKISSGGKHLLEHSYELDDAPDFERFFFITSENEINTESVIFSAEMLAVERKKAMTANLSFTQIMDESLNQISVLIKKD